MTGSTAGVRLFVLDVCAECMSRRGQGEKGHKNKNVLQGGRRGVRRQTEATKVTRLRNKVVF